MEQKIYVKFLLYAQAAQALPHKEDVLSSWRENQDLKKSLKSS